MPYDLPDWLSTKVSPEPNSGCWLWTAATDEDGYGWVRLGRHKGKSFHHPAHRLIFEFYNGPVPTELVMDHLCRTHCCVNPEHLEAVTDPVNILRGTGASARNAVKQFCAQGHSLADAYLVSGARKCRVCQKSRAMERYYANRDNINARRRKNP